MDVDQSQDPDRPRWASGARTVGRGNGKVPTMRELASTDVSHQHRIITDRLGVQLGADDDEGRPGRAVSDHRAQSLVAIRASRHDGVVGTAR